MRIGHRDLSPSRGGEPSSTSQQAGCIKWHFPHTPPAGIRDAARAADLGVSQPAAPRAGPCHKGAASLGAAPPSSFLLLLPALPLWFQAQCFSTKPASTCVWRLAHSSPKSPLSHGIDVSRAPAVKQWRLRLGERCQAKRAHVSPQAGEQHSPPSRNRHIASTQLPTPGHKT